jgi:hypothetical protein
MQLARVLLLIALRRAESITFFGFSGLRCLIYRSTFDHRFNDSAV